MVVYIVNIVGVTFNKPENDAPVSVHRHSMKTSQIAAQCMQSKPWQIHVRQSGRCIKPGQNTPQLVRMIRPHTTMIVRLMQTIQSLV